MANKSERKVVAKSAAKRVRKPAAAPSPPASGPAPVGPKGLLRAGLKALNDARDDAIRRQSRVFEALLGLDTSDRPSQRSQREWKLLNTPDAANMQKFEEVFDQRVARSLERLGMPSPQALAALCRQLEAINEHLKRMEPQAKGARAPRRRPARP
jgi:hypothetical protein